MKLTATFGTKLSPSLSLSFSQAAHGKGERGNEGVTGSANSIFSLSQSLRAVQEVHPGVHRPAARRVLTPDCTLWMITNTAGWVLT